MSETGKKNYWLAYLVGWITGLVFLATEKEDEDMRFHAAQSVVVFGAVQVFYILARILGFIPLIGGLLGLLSWIVSLGSLVLWILLMVKAGNGEKYELPIAADLAKQYCIDLFK